MTPAAAIASALGVSAATVLAVARGYTMTNHGDNPLTIEATKNLLYCHAWIDKAVGAVGGSLNSAYRSPEVNAAVGGSPTSDHMRGLAADIKPGKLYDVEGAFRLLRGMAERGELGPVRQVIWEPTWVHVGWKAPGSMPGGPISLLKKVGPDFVRVA